MLGLDLVRVVPAQRPGEAVGVATERRGGAGAPDALLPEQQQLPAPLGLRKN